jgi:hypothetical protein
MKKIGRKKEQESDAPARLNDARKAIKLHLQRAAGEIRPRLAVFAFRK